MEINLDKSYGNGLYQKGIFSFAALFPLVGGFIFQTTIFDGYIPSFKCNTSLNEEVFWFKNIDDVSNSSVQCFYSPSMTGERSKCPSFIYETNVMVSNYVTQFDLVCDQEYLLKWLDAIYFIFQTFTWLWAIISDIVGRKIIITTLVCGQMSAAIIILFANNLILLFICRAILGVCSMLTYFGFFYIMEILPESKRFWSNSYWTSWSIGYCLTTIVAYFGRSSFWIHLFALVPIAMYIPLLIFMKESPSWLMTRNRFDESAAIIASIAKLNKSTNPIDKEQLINELKAEKANKDKIQVSESLLSYCMKFRLFMTSAILAITYCFLVSGYYVISNSTSFLFENLYLNTIVQGLLEIPTSITSALICMYFKRRLTNISLILLVAICILINGFLANYETLKIIFGIIGKFALANALCTVSYVVGEVTPVSLHGSGFFSVVTLAHLISAFSSFIYRTSLPIHIVYSAFALALSVSSILLFVLVPETKNVNSILTISDAINLHKTKQCIL